MSKKFSLVFLLALAVPLSGCGSWLYFGQQPSVYYRTTHEHMPEETRRAITSVKVVSDSSKPKLSVGGDYGRYVPTAGEGAAEGMVGGAKVTGAMVAEDPRAIFFVPLILPVALITGVIGGAVGTKIEQALAEFREGLTDDVLADSDLLVPADEIASKVRRLLENTGFAANSDAYDAELSITVSEITVNTENNDAVITSYAVATLKRREDDSSPYSRSVTYSEKNTLRNWAADDSVMWNDYILRARRFIAAEVVANMFETIHLRHVLRPVETKTFSGGWSGRVKSAHPTLAWELFLLGGDEYSDKIDEQDVLFDLRMLDDGHVVHEVRNVRGSSYQVPDQLSGCKELHWSVRPVYSLAGHLRAGEWMQYFSGSETKWGHDWVSSRGTTSEFWHYFAKFKTRCSS
jgi:hypothetical protein